MWSGSAKWSLERVEEHRNVAGAVARALCFDIGLAAHSLGCQGYCLRYRNARWGGVRDGGLWEADLGLLWKTRGARARYRPVYRALAIRRHGTQRGIASKDVGVPPSKTGVPRPPLWVWLVQGLRIVLTWCDVHASPTSFCGFATTLEGGTRRSCSRQHVPVGYGRLLGYRNRTVFRALRQAGRLTHHGASAF